MPQRRIRNPDICLDIYVCVPCNLRIEKEKPWLLQRKPEPEGLHKLLHTLVLATDPGAVAPPEQPLTTEKRLERLEKRLEQLEKSIEELHSRHEKTEKSVTDRLQQLGDLLGRVKPGLVGNGSN